MKSPWQQQVSGNWKQFTGKIKELWGDLSDDELDKFEGKQEQLEGFLEEKTGEERSAIRKKIDRIAESMKERS